MKSNVSTNPFHRAIFDTIPAFVLFDLVAELRSAYKLAFMETLGNPAISTGIAREHFPQERRLKIQQALVAISLKHSRYLTYDEKRTKPKGGGFVTVKAQNIILVEKFLTNSLKLPLPKYISYLTAQPSIFDNEPEIKNPIFAVIIHGYDKTPIFQDCPDFIDIIFPDPVDPSNVRSALFRIELINLEFTAVAEEPSLVIPDATITLKEEVKIDTVENDLERGELN